MSYSFQVSLDESGQPQVSGYSGTLHGPVSVNGHEDGTSASVGVTRLDEQGGSVIQANAYKTIRQEPEVPSG